MTLVIFHYHLLPGGVTSVIREAVAAIRGHSTQVSRILVVADVPAGDPQPVVGAETVRMEEIGYRLGPPAGRKRTAAEARRLSEVLLERFAAEDSVWWVHNYHLGKNPVFTEALLRVASTAGAPAIVLQPHDFPEAGRYDALSVLQRTLGQPMYPVGPGIRYAVINRRDLAVLGEAGIPPDRLFLLENPVPCLRAEAAGNGDRHGIRKLLFPTADPLHPVLLYPVRSIRRKNVLEAGLVTHLAGPTVRLVVTLPGVSETEKPYSELVEQAFRSGLIPGELGTGARRPDLRLGRLAAACDAVVSSSIQEGFGYLFVQALQWGLPLVARRLDTAPVSDDLYDGYPAAFYDRLSCPLSDGERKRLLLRYRTRLRRLQRVIGSRAARSLEGELAAELAGDGVDVSYLDTTAQLRQLAAAAHVQGYPGELRRMNPKISEALGAALSVRPRARVAEVERRFGPAAYAAGVDRILASFQGPSVPGPHPDPALIQRRVRQSFLRSEYLRLLYE